jgi:polysaccharide export outer membrane protein
MTSVSPALRIAALTIAAVAGGCSGLPNAGPVQSQVVAGAGLYYSGSDQFDYTLINVDERISLILNGYTRYAFADRFGSHGAGMGESIGVGDTLAVSIFEAGADGLFSTIERKQTDLIVVVDNRGQISVPYAGDIRVAGSTTRAVEDAINEALQKRALEPDVLVRIADNQSRTVTVSGSVALSKRVPLGLRGLRVLDAIALAGGAKHEPYETYVSLTRGSQREVVLLQTIVDSPRENIFVRPNDVIYLYHGPRTFSALGSVKKEGRIPFGSRNLDMIEAIALAGGLDDSESNPEGFFLFRYEYASVVYELTQGAGPVPVETDGAKGPSAAGYVPVVYRFDLRNPDTYLFAQAFPVRDKDVVYVAHQVSVEFEKFLNIVSKAAQPVIVARSITRR